MDRKTILASAVGIAVLVGYAGMRHRAGAVPVLAASNQQTSAVVDATHAFLKTLTPDQRSKVHLAFTPQKSATIARFHRTPDGGVAPGAPTSTGASKGTGGPGGEHAGPLPNGQHAGPPPNGSSGGGFGQGPPGGFVGEQYGSAVWSNYPVSDVLRPGLQIGSLTVAQRDAAMRLLQVLLSAAGYQKVREIMGSDQALADAGTNFASGEAVYTIAIFGEPSVDKPWMIEFGGHHLGLNVVIAGSKGVLTPTLTGAQPAIYKHGDATIRVLAKENDTAFALLDALSKDQQKKAVLEYDVSDLVLGPGHAGEKIQPEGIKGSELNDKQRALLLDVISQWANIVNGSYARPRMAEIESELNDTYFAWSGPLTHAPGKNGSSYYRIQGPHLVIEFSPQSVGGDATMHVHTIYRDPTNDYGIALTGAE